MKTPSFKTPFSVLREKMSPFSMKQRSLPCDLPLSDLAPLQEYIGSSGGYWKIYRSKLISSQVEVSVFLFDKAACNKHKQKKTILSSVWRHVDMIQNIQKYSSVTLKIVLTAKENRRYVAYATEPVVGSLANVLGDYPNDISPTHASVLNKMSCLCEMEIKYGVAAIAEALSYLHLYEAMIHCDVSPRSIIVCTNGSWRLSGFHFMMKAEAPHQLILNHTRPDSVTTNFLQPDINFAAPCLFLGTPAQESDIFSLGMLITCVYNNGISLMEGTAVVNEIYTTSAKEMVQLYDERMSSAYNAIKSKIPEGLQHGLSKMISFDVETRPTAQQFMMLGYYHDPLIKYLKRLNLFDNLTESDRGVVLSTELPECAKNLPQTMLMSHVIPILTEELQQSHFYPGVVHSVLICLSRILTTANTETVCKLVNQVMAINTAAMLSPQSHEMVMKHISQLYIKSSQITCLYSPLPVVMLGLADETKVVATLDAITEIVKYHSGVTILTDTLREEVKKVFEQHWRQGNKGICRSFQNSILCWLSTLGEQSLTQNFTLWFVELIHRNLDILNVIRDVIMTMLADRDKYTLTETFIEKELSLAVEKLVAHADITNAQRHTLVQLARYMEKSPAVTANKCSSTGSKIISTDIGHVPNQPSTTIASRSLKITLQRQSNTNIAPQEIRSATPPPQTPMLIVTKPKDSSENQVQKSESPKLLHSQLFSHEEDAASQRRKLFQLDRLLARSKNTSFGELMADIDDRATILTGGSRSPYLARGSRASSLQTPSSQGSPSDESHGRRPSLQAYRSLSAPAIDRSHTQEVCDNGEPNTIDTSVMKSILQRLDSLTAQFTSKSAIALSDDSHTQ